MDLSPNIVLTSPNGSLTLGTLCSFQATAIVKSKRQFSHTRVILEILIDQKIKVALRRLRSKFGYHHVRRIGQNILRITLTMRSRLYDANGYLQARIADLRYALNNQRQPKKRYKDYKKLRVVA